MILPWLLLLPFILYFTVLGGLKDASLGRTEVKAQEVFSLRSLVTEAKLYALQGQGDPVSDREFPVPSGNDEPVFGELSLSGEDLNRFLDIWGKQEVVSGSGGMCHMPGYGVRLFNKKKQIVETSVCWDCANIGVKIYPGVRLTKGFAADSPAAAELLQFCDEKLPLVKRDADEILELESFPKDLTTPPVTEEKPAPGKRVKQWLEEYEGTELYHALYLPRDWEPGKEYPVIFEYSGNEYKESLGIVDECDLGYGISGGKEYIWVCLPYVAEDGKSNQGKWWGNFEATVDYCKKAVPLVCEEFGGNPGEVFLAGFSRGSIACNYIGLHDDEIAEFWCGFICHSHYDGVKKWGYPGSDRESAFVRLKRLKNRPQYISQEKSVRATYEYLHAEYRGNFNYTPLPFAIHTDEWVLHDHQWREDLRKWTEHVRIRHGGRFGFK